MLFAPAAAADEISEALIKQEDQVELALDKALIFLSRQQLEDGSFQASAFKSAVTSLCVMSFLAKGHTPGDGPYGEIINKGIDYVLTTAAEDGQILGPNPGHGTMYVHTINTLMLSEVSGMVDRKRQERIDVVLSKAMKIILVAQQVRKGDARQQGGWRYTPQSNDSDMSCSGWALMSMRSARNNGAAVPKESIDQAVAYIIVSQHPNGLIGYQPGGGGETTTQVGLLCLELCGQHRSAASLLAGDYLLNNLQRTYGAGYFYYGLYYASQGMFQLGGTYWEKFAAYQYEMMLPKQNPDGSWQVGGGAEAGAGICYSTAMSVLALSVSCRQLPIYQR
ncbi:MAG: prenyltransferase [Phycisphaerae bacterium]|nr:prenyltransferase [Phycisphaerae bacterium]